MRLRKHDEFGRWCVKGVSYRTPTGPSNAHHSQTLSCYCTTWELLAAGFPPWPGALRLRRPGALTFRCEHHIDAVLSADARSTCADEGRKSQRRRFLPPGLQAVRLQAHTTTPSRLTTVFLTKSITLLANFIAHLALLICCQYNANSSQPSTLFHWSVLRLFQSTPSHTPCINCLFSDWPDSSKFRPIANTCAFLKVAEEQALQELRRSMAENNDNAQFAYKANQSTCDAVATLAHTILK